MFSSYPHLLRKPLSHINEDLPTSIEDLTVALHSCGNDQDAYSVKSTAATANDEGSFTIYFAGQPESANHLPIAEGWNYIVRLCQPRKAILDGTWKFPEVEPVKSD